MNRLFAKLLILALFPLMGGGCSWQGVLTTVGIAGAAGAGAAAVYYAKGDLESNIDDDVKDVHKASLDVLKDRGYTIDSESHDALSSSVDATAPSNTDEKTTVKIRSSRQGDDTTKISIRVGVFGDEALSRELLKDIEGKVK